ncbi:hypothetical protein BGX23_001732 [Mortierella sp. AD031]|nr:hypothetical protein BGX23_001732 [Mortierella sp. AD031]
MSSQPSIITLNIRASRDRTYPISVSLTDTVLQLKERVALVSNTPSDRMRLVYSGRVLKDTTSIEFCRVTQGNIIHMVRNPLSTATITTTAAASAMDSSSTIPATTGTPTVTSESTSPFISHSPRPTSPAASTSRDTHIPQSGSFSSPSPSPPPLSGFGARNSLDSGAGGNHGMEMEADIMDQMMQDLMFAHFMSSMLQNPQILESMVATNPMLQAMLGPEMRLILQSPQFRQMVASPDTLRQVAQMRMGPTTSRSMGAAGGYSTSAFGTPSTTTSISSMTTPTTSTTTTGVAGAMGLQSGIRLPSSLISVNAPEKRFQVQLQQLSEMGFWDPTKNMRALQVSGGDVNSAIEILCSGV